MSQFVTELVERIKRHEGLRLKPYKCTADKLTIGYGRNIEDAGITVGEAEYLLSGDILRCRQEAEQYPFFAHLSRRRQGVVIEMLFQLGRTRFNTFKRFQAALENRDWVQAAVEMRDSRWRTQTPNRAQTLIKIMEEG